MTDPYSRPAQFRKRLFFSLSLLILPFFPYWLLAQQAIRIEPDYYNGEIIISDTLVPLELTMTLFTNKDEALSALEDPVALDSLPDIGTWLYRTGALKKYPVLMISRKEHWAIIHLKEYEGYGTPVISRVKLKRQTLVMIEASQSERFFTSEEFPSGFQAKRGLLEVIDVITGRRQLQQVSHLSIEQGRWSKGPEGNTASSYEQELSVIYVRNTMQIKVSTLKQRYSTASGKEEKSQQISLEYEFRDNLWLRRKAVMVGF